MNVDVNIAFCRTLLRGVVDDVRKHFPGIKVSRAAVLESGIGHNKQYLFEYVHPGEERWSTYVSADNAYEARANGWMKWLGHKGVEDYQ